jgi:hypothetical protein
MGSNRYAAAVSSKGRKKLFLISLAASVFTRVMQGFFMLGSRATLAWVVV